MKRPTDPDLKVVESGPSPGALFGLGVLVGVLFASRRQKQGKAEQSPMGSEAKKSPKGSEAKKSPKGSEAKLLSHPVPQESTDV